MSWIDDDARHDAEQEMRMRVAAGEHIHHPAAFLRRAARIALTSYADQYHREMEAWAAIEGRPYFPMLNLRAANAERQRVFRQVHRERLRPAKQERDRKRYDTDEYRAKERARKQRRTAAARQQREAA